MKQYSKYEKRLSRVVQVLDYSQPYTVRNGYTLRTTSVGIATTGVIEVQFHDVTATATMSQARKRVCS
jgi:hypothetical protein